MRLTAPVGERMPLTPLGAGTLAIGFLVWLRYAEPRQDYVAEVAAWSLMGLVGFQVLAVFYAWARFRILLRAPDTENKKDLWLQARRGAEAGMVLPRFGHWLGVDLEMSWERPAAMELSLQPHDQGWQETMRGERRLMSSEIVRRLRVRSVFGLAQLGVRWTEAARVRVAPWSGEDPQPPLLQALAQGAELSDPRGPPQGDRVDMRAYAPGDPIRLVLWKIFARTDELMVRTAESAVDPDLRWAMYLVNHEDDEASAAIAYLLLERGLLGPDWWFGCDLDPDPTSELQVAQDRICASGTPSFDGEASGRGPASGLTSFAAATARHGRRRLLVLAPPRPGAWMEAVRSQITGEQAVVWVGYDRMVDRGPRRLFAAAPATPGQVDVSPSEGAALRRAFPGTAMAWVSRSTGGSDDAQDRGKAA